MLGYIPRRHTVGVARSYEPGEIKQVLVDLLAKSKTGLSGGEISEKLGVNRVTMAKYLNVFAAEGLIRRRKIGNATLWNVESGTEQFRFPDDYFHVQKKYQDCLLEHSEDRAYSLIRNSMHSGARAAKIMTEVVVPTVVNLRKIFDDGRIGSSEIGLLSRIVSNSIQVPNLEPADPDPAKNVVLIAADPASALLCEAASAAFRRENWRVVALGDMSASVNVLFDLDLQKFLGKIWRPKSGFMLVIVFSETEEGLNFFAQAVDTSRKKFGRGIRLVLCGKVSKKTSIESDLTTEDLGEIFQWSQTAYEGSVR